MSYSLVFLVAGAFISDGESPKPSKATKADLKMIQGVWEFTESWDNGKHSDTRSLHVAVRFTTGIMEYGRLIDGTFRSEKKPQKFKFKLDASRSPKHLDADLGVRVYVLKKNTFIIVGFATGRKDRPKSKKDRPDTAPEKGVAGDGLWIGVFKRVRKKAKAK